MLTLHGRIVNVFLTPSGVKKDTGEIYGGMHRVQLLAEALLKNGERRVELVDLTVDDPKPFSALQGQQVDVPVGVFVAAGVIRFFHQRTATTPVREARAAA